MKKTKIVASLSPKTKDPKLIMDMVLEGVDVFRMDLNQMDKIDCEELISIIRNIEQKTKKIIGIMFDIDGPSIQLDKLMEESVYLERLKEIKIYNYHVVCNNTQLSTNHEHLTDLIEVDDIITIGNGDVKLKVLKINKDNFLCQVIDDGFVKSHQTVHIGKNYQNMPFLNEKDLKNIEYAIEQNIDFLSLSYVRDEQDVLDVVDLLIQNENEHISILAKIETEEAFENLDEILKVSDGVIIARGDLGVNTDLWKLPYYQKEILKKANEYQKIGLVSTDFLKSMMQEKSPSRAEVSDIYNIVLDKADGLILRDETKLGDYPVESVSVMRKILEEAEANFPYQENLEQTFKEGKLDVTATISYSVVDSGLLLNASCILANTMSGYTARKISYFKPKSPVLGLSPNKSTVRSLTLNYGIIPVLVKKYIDTDQIISMCIQKYKEIMDYKQGDLVIITGGLPLNNKNTDFMKIEKIDE